MCTNPCNDSGKPKIGRWGPGWPGQKVRPYLQITRTKRDSGMTPVVEHLPTKGKDLGLDPSSAKKKRIVFSIILPGNTPGYWKEHYQ
jgi:hypothetical protein